MTKCNYLIFCLAILPLSAHAGKLPDEKNCTKAIAMMEETLSKMEVKTARDEEDIRVIKERQEKLIKEGRAKRLSECEIWSQVMKLAFTQ